MKKTNHSGFTLIELMIVVAIIAILASVAYPSYTNSVLKGKRAEGRAALAELMLQQERYMTQTNSYCAFSNSNGTTTAGTGCTTVPFKTYSGDSPSNPAYYLSADACTPPNIRECVVLTATPVKADPEAGNLQILSTGTKTCTGGSNPAVCWK
jgi:type IV pilus assembly protein PilE